MTDRPIAPQARPEDKAHEAALRPQTLDDMIGQETVKTNLRILIEAARQRGEALDHVILHGPPGLGKTSFAWVIANEMGAQIRVTAGPAIERQGDLASILSNLHKGDVLFIDEVHRLGKAVAEILYPAMEDYALDIVIGGKGPGARSVRLKLPRFTVIGATTRLALLPSPLRARFGAAYRLDFYDRPAMEAIVQRSADLMGLKMTPGGRQEVARRARGTPRVANHLLRRVRDYAQVRGDGTITQQAAEEALALLGVDPLGLDDLDRKVLHSLIGKFDGGPVGLDTIAASLSEEADTIMDVVEPYLLQLGFLERTARGRLATRHAYEHLGLTPPPPSAQPMLFDGKNDE